MEYSLIKMVRIKFNIERRLNIFYNVTETYNLGVGQTMNGTLISCETPTKINGTCKLLESCNELSSIVKNLDILLFYSCKINE